MHCPEVDRRLSVLLAFLVLGLTLPQPVHADAVPVLNEAAETLKAEGSIAVIVEGHTDSVGTDAYNQKLSHRRADAVRQYLVKHGIPANRVTTEGFGESRPVASNDTADGRAQNRRVELRVD